MNLPCVRGKFVSTSASTFTFASPLYPMSLFERLSGLDPKLNLFFGLHQTNFTWFVFCMPLKTSIQGLCKYHPYTVDYMRNVRGTLAQIVDSQLVMCLAPISEIWIGNFNFELDENEHGTERNGVKTQRTTSIQHQVV